MFPRARSHSPHLSSKVIKRGQKGHRRHDHQRRGQRNDDFTADAVIDLNRSISGQMRHSGYPHEIKQCVNAVEGFGGAQALRSLKSFAGVWSCIRCSIGASPWLYWPPLTSLRCDRRDKQSSISEARARNSDLSQSVTGSSDVAFAITWMDRMIDAQGKTFRDIRVFRGRPWSLRIDLQAGTSVMRTGPLRTGIRSHFHP
ncbi:MAG: hypothetical protein RI963_3562 [Planctomycetota bacterium]